MPILVTSDNIKSGAKANAHHSWHRSIWDKTNKILTVNVLGYLILTNRLLSNYFSPSSTLNSEDTSNEL